MYCDCIIFFNDLFAFKISGFCHGIEEFSLFWVVTQCVLVSMCQYFKTAYQSHLQESKQTNIQCIKTQKNEDLKLFPWF